MNNTRGEKRKRNWAAKGPIGEGEAKRLREQYVLRMKKRKFTYFSYS
jgi:hypothetical protein